MKEQNTLTYSTALTELDDIVQKMEAGEIGIDQMSDQVARAAELIKWCEHKLRGTEETVDKIFYSSEIKALTSNL